MLCTRPSVGNVRTRRIASTATPISTTLIAFRKVVRLDGVPPWSRPCIGCGISRAPRRRLRPEFSITGGEAHRVHGGCTLSLVDHGARIEGVLGLRIMGLMADGAQL